MKTPIITRKIHLYSLPEVLPEPLPSYDDSNTEMVILLPLFAPESQPAPEIFVRAMLYNKRAILRNSDVMERCVPVRFYIQDSVYTQIKDYIYSQGVSEEDVLIFNADDYPLEDIHNASFPNLGFKCLPFLDDRLLGYDRICVLDVDMFLCRTAMAGMRRFEITKQIQKVPENQIGVCRINYYRSTPTNPVPGNWLARMKGRNVKLWFDTVNEITPLLNRNVFSYDNGSIYVFPTQFNTHYPEFASHAVHAIGKMRDDEAVMSLWRQMHTETGYSLSYMGLPYLRTDEAIVDAENIIGFYYMHVVDNYIKTWYTHI